MRIRVEISSLATPHQSGVASFTRLLTTALASRKDIDVRGHYFNFLKRQPHPNFEDSRIHFEENPTFPLRVYAKLQSLSYAPPFDIALPRVDLTIFPNFATWPTSKSRLTATSVHDLTYMYYPDLVEDANLAHLRRVVPRSIKAADIILTVSESVKMELVKEFGLNPNRCIAMPVPPEPMFHKRCTQQELETVRKKYNIGSKKYLLFLGNFEPRKNLKTLVAAYQTLPKDTQSEYRLILAGGKGWKSEETQKMIDDALTNGADIKHIGYIDAEDRPALYQASSLYVMPSLYEGFGIPVLEAMASEIPVIAADIPVLREAGGKAAHYFSPEDPNDLMKKIQNVLIKPATQKTMIKDGLQQLESFSWDKNVDALLAGIKSLG